MTHKVSVVVEHDPNGYYVWCPGLPGCQSQGRTRDEALEHIREAIESYIETLTPEERDDYLRRDVHGVQN